MEFLSGLAIRRSPVSLPPSWRRFKARRTLLPVCTESVVFLAFLRIAENFIRFVDFLEFFLRHLFVLGNVRMVLAGEFAKGFFYFLIAGSAADAECGVIIFEFNRHGSFLRCGFGFFTVVVMNRHRRGGSFP